jgi:hypothetical protein
MARPGARCGHSWDTTGGHGQTLHRASLIMNQWSNEIFIANKLHVIQKVADRGVVSSELIFLLGSKSLNGSVQQWYTFVKNDKDPEASSSN